MFRPKANFETFCPISGGTEQNGTDNDAVKSSHFISSYHSFCLSLFGVVMVTGSGLGKLLMPVKEATLLIEYAMSDRRTLHILPDTKLIWGIISYPSNTSWNYRTVARKIVHILKSNSHLVCKDLDADARTVHNEIPSLSGSITNFSRHYLGSGPRVGLSTRCRFWPVPSHPFTTPLSIPVTGIFSYLAGSACGLLCMVSLLV